MFIWRGKKVGGVDTGEKDTGDRRVVDGGMGRGQASLHTGLGEEES